MGLEMVRLGSVCFKLVRLIFIRLNFVRFVGLVKVSKKG